MIHIHGIWYAPTPKRCDVRVSKKVHSETHRKLKHEMEEKKISAELVADHNARVRELRSTLHWVRD